MRRREILKRSAMAAFAASIPTALRGSDCHREGIDCTAPGPRDSYFRWKGTSQVLVGRNPCGFQFQDYVDLIDATHEASEHLLRIHFTYPHPNERPGEIEPKMLRFWTQILERAMHHQIAVIPVMGLWSYWNDGSQGEVWPAWHENNFNVVRGGPTNEPSELFRASETQRLWLQRLEHLIQAWSPFENIVAWELFSEVDLVTGATPKTAREFVDRAARVVRVNDSRDRPTTASLSGVIEWPEVLESEAVQIVQLHPYSGGIYQGRLDELIVKTVRQRIDRYRKPVMIGECGLDFGRPKGDSFDAAVGADIGLRHAMWASVVSGSATSRMFWWQDGYDITEGVQLNKHYHRFASQILAWIDGVDFKDFVPIEATMSPNVFGACLGNSRCVLGWFRDGECVAPEWKQTSIDAGKTTIALESGRWKLQWFSPNKGNWLHTEEYMIDQNEFVLELPRFQDSIAVKLNCVP